MNQNNNSINPPPAQIPVNLVQGSHLVLNCPCPGFIYTESADGRVMFFRPWQGKTLVGTTETPYSGNPAGIKPTEDEIRQILDTYNHYFPESACNKADIAGTYCGLRVLPENAGTVFSASRETLIHCNDKHQPNYIAVYGGKLTTYRKASENVLKSIGKTIKAPHQADTRKIMLKKHDAKQFNFGETLH